MSQAEYEYLGPYRVDRVLGRGGMGSVYKGIHARSGEAVAIKVIATGIANQPRFRRRFASEVEALKRLKHPNIVELLGYGEEQGILFYSMEYVDGHTLHEHLRQHEKLPWEDVIQVAIETTAALKHAHNLGIIHRDLKPANLMLASDGRIKLTDFGIAKLFGSSDETAAGSVIGTADYMPPEQAEGKPVTVRTDLYSLGCVMYALLSGKAPFGGKSVPEVLYAVRYNPVPSLQERAQGVPPELVELVHELLEKDPQKRPPTALVVSNRLRALQQGLKSRSKLVSTDPVQAEEPVGTILTSLDLSDVDDDELRLTSDEMQELGVAQEPLGTTDGKSEVDPLDVDSREFSRAEPIRPGTHVDGLGTHDQQTLVAPDGFFAKESVLGKNLADKESEMSLAPGIASSVEQESPVPLDKGPSHFTPVSEMKRENEFGTSERDGHDWLHYVSIAGMVALLLGSIGWGWWMLRPATADALYATIDKAAGTGDDGQLLAVSAEMESFLTRFPEDERAVEVQILANETDLVRRVKLLQRKASMTGGKQELSIVEQGFLSCMEARMTDADAGKEKLNAFVSVFDKLDNLDRSDLRLLELAKFTLERGSQIPLPEVPLAQEQLQQLIQAAEKSLKPEQLNRYYANLLALYAGEDWAQEQLQRIRERLETESAVE